MLPKLRTKRAKACCWACSASWALICDFDFVERLDFLRGDLHHLEDRVGLRLFERAFHLALRRREDRRVKRFRQLSFVDSRLQAAGAFGRVRRVFFRDFFPAFDRVVFFERGLRGFDFGLVFVLDQANVARFRRRVLGRLGRFVVVLDFAAARLRRFAGDLFLDLGAEDLDLHPFVDVRWREVRFFEEFLVLLSRFEGWSLSFSSSLATSFGVTVMPISSAWPWIQIASRISPSAVSFSSSYFSSPGLGPV